jgi:autotransporter-associated beta strand protein
MRRLISPSVGLLLCCLPAPTRAAPVTFIATSDTQWFAVASSNASMEQELTTMNTIAGKTFPSSLGGGTIGTPLGVVVAGDLTDNETGPGQVQEEWANWQNDWGLTGTGAVGPTGNGQYLHLPVYETWGNRDSNSIVQDGIIARNLIRAGLTAISPVPEGCTDPGGINYSWDWGNLHLVTAGLYPANANLSLQHPTANDDPRQSLNFVINDLAQYVGDSGRPVAIALHVNLPQTDGEFWLPSQVTDFYNAIRDYNVVAILDGHHSGGLSTWNGITCLDGDHFTDGYWVVQIDGTQFTAARTADGGNTWNKTTLSKTIRTGAVAAVWNLAGGGSWASAASWNGGITPQFLGDTATFGNAIGSTPATVTLDGDCLASGLIFNNTTAGYTLAAGSGGGTLRLHTTNASVPVSVTGSHQVTAPVSLVSPATISVDPGSVLTISGAVSGTGTGVAKIGGGTLILSGANSYTGSTTVSGGTLQMGSPGALGFGAAVPLGGTLPATSINATGTLDLNGQTTGGQITLAGGSLVNSSTNRATQGCLAGVLLTSGGSGVSPGATVSLGGSAAAVTASLGLTAASFSLSSSGSGYAVDDILNVSGGGSGAQIEVTAVSGGTGTTGPIANWQLWAPGSGYTLAPTGISGGSGSGAAITGNANNFQVVSLNTTAPGGGYTTPPTVSLSSGSGFAATAVLSSINLTAPSSIGGPGDIAIPAAITGGFGFNKIGTGTLTLSGSNTYSGGTTVSSGILVLESSAAIPGGSLLLVGTAGSVVLGESGYMELGLISGGAGSGLGPLAGPQTPAPVNSVPEPGTLALLAAGLACGFGLRPRRLRTAISARSCCN